MTIPTVSTEDIEAGERELENKALGSKPEEDRGVCPVSAPEQTELDSHGLHQGSSDSAIQRLIDAVMMAPKAVGDPRNRGKGEEVGYFKFLAEEYPSSFLSLYPHILPLQMAIEREEEEMKDIDEKLLEKLLRKIESLAQEKSRANQERINAAASDGGIRQRPRLRESNADQHCINAARERGVRERPRLRKPSSDQDGVNAIARENAVDQVSRLTESTAHQNGVNATAPGQSAAERFNDAVEPDSLAGTVVACRYLCES